MLSQNRLFVRDGSDGNLTDPTSEPAAAIAALPNNRPFETLARITGVAGRWPARLTTQHYRYASHAFLAAIAFGVVAAASIATDASAAATTLQPAASTWTASKVEQSAIVARPRVLPATESSAAPVAATVTDRTDQTGGGLVSLASMLTGAGQLLAVPAVDQPTEALAPSVSLDSPKTLGNVSRLEAMAAPAIPEPQASTPDIKTYVVQSGDNPFDLASGFNISEETLLSANGLTPDDLLSIGQKLLIPPVNGIVVTSIPGDTVASVAGRYSVDPLAIMKANKLDPTNPGIAAGGPLVLPGVVPPVQIYGRPADDSGASTAPAPASAAPLASSRPSQAPASVAAVKPAAPPASPPAPIIKTPAVATHSLNYFPYGQCTYWAAQQRPDIGSRVVGNAASWLYSARSNGLATGSIPQAGAVVVYQPGAQGAAWTGHVGYVTSVAADGVHFTISEMNFPYFARVTTRASFAGPGVGFIY